MDAFLPLIGVVVGGILTLSGQVAIEIRKDWISAKNAAQERAVIARVQQDALWTFQSTLARAFADGNWPTRGHSGYIPSGLDRHSQDCGGSGTQRVGGVLQRD
jgi:hypothetical protein